MEMSVSCLLLLLRVFTYGTINKGFAFAYLDFTLIVFLSFTRKYLFGFFL